MITSGLCHGPGCTREASGDFCSEKCATAWAAELADTSPPAATIQIEWVHPHRGEVVENLCKEHAAELQRALQHLGMGLIGSRFDATVCVRCKHRNAEPRSWLDACVVGNADLMVAGANAAYPQVASKDPQVGFLARWFRRVFGRTT